MLEKENSDKNEPPKKSFKSFLKESAKENKEKGKSKSNESDAELLLKQMRLNSKLSNSNKTISADSSSTAPVDDSVLVERLFPALFSDENSDVIKDYSIKSYIKICSTKSLEWVHNMNFDNDDIMYKNELQKILEYHIYPPVNYDRKYDRVLNSQSSKASSFLNDDFNKEWFMSLKDCYMKWLSFDDPEGSSVEFTLITNQYKVIFISQGCLRDGRNIRKRYAIVGNPSDKLLEMLKRSSVCYKRFNKPQNSKKKRNRGDGALIDIVEEDEEEESLVTSEPAFTQPLYGSTQELFQIPNNGSQDNELIDINVMRS